MIEMIDAVCKCGIARKAKAGKSILHGTIIMASAVHGRKAYNFLQSWDLIAKLCRYGLDCDGGEDLCAHVSNGHWVVAERQKRHFQPPSLPVYKSIAQERR